MIYRAKNLSPENLSINGQEDNVFSCTIVGDTCDAYTFKVYQLNGTLVATSGKITFPDIKFNGEQIQHTLASGTLTNNQSYMFTFECFEGSNSVVSAYTQFYADTPPTVSLSFTTPIVSQKIDLRAVYSQSNGISIGEFSYIIKDNTGTVIADYSKTGTQDTRYTFSGFINNISGTIEFRGFTVRGMEFTTGALPFTVNYPEPTISIEPSTVLDKISSFVKYTWGKIVKINGSSTGTTQYVSDYFATNSKALQLNTGATLSYDMVFGEDFTLSYKLDLTNFSNGIFCKLYGEDGNTYELGYDDVLNKFYFNHGEITLNSQLVTGTLGKAYVFILPQEVRIVMNGLVYNIKSS